VTNLCNRKNTTILNVACQTCISKIIHKYFTTCIQAIPGSDLGPETILRLLQFSCLSRWMLQLYNSCCVTWVYLYKIYETNVHWPKSCNNFYRIKWNNNRQFWYGLLWESCTYGILINIHKTDHCINIPSSKV
jgi:hypothetical protein